MPLSQIVSFEWHQLDGYNAVAKVHGGWIVKTLEDHYQIDQHSQQRPTGGFTPTMVFVPDPNHEWEMESLIGIHG
jgi:hypothetical protein